MRTAVKHELTLDEIGQLLELGPDVYRRRVVELFRSGQATQAHWNALGRAMLHVSESDHHGLIISFDTYALMGSYMPLCRIYRARVLALFREGRASPEQWHAMGAALLVVSESSEGYTMVSIDRAVLAQSHEQKGPPWLRPTVRSSVAPPTASRAS